MSTFAQIVGDTITSGPVLYTYGPMGVLLAWFMLRGEKLAAEIRSLSHRIDGLTKALLVDMIDRDGCGSHAKEYAQEAIRKIDDRSRPSTSDKS